MANVNTSINRLYAATAVGSAGEREGYVSGVTKATQNDTITVLNANTIINAYVTDVTTGVLDPVTISGNVLTLIGATTGTVDIRIIYK
jgi:hypothetical protein